MAVTVPRVTIMPCVIFLLSIKVQKKKSKNSKHQEADWWHPI